VRKLSKAHLSFVRGQPCLICQQSPSDPHHLKFAQQRALGRKVSDEFTVPLCRPHHQDLHRHGNEKAWWANMQIAPMPIAKQLWDASQTGGQEQAAVSENAAHTHQYPRDSQHEAPFILLKACGAPQQSAPIQSEGELSAFSSSFQRLAHYLLGRQAHAVSSDRPARPSIDRALRTAFSIFASILVSNNSADPIEMPAR
jgi:hypothetical protein